MIRRSPWLALSVLCLPMLIVSMDVSVLFFAVPGIAADLAPSPTQLLWIFDIYGFILAGGLLTMGAGADRVGHRRLLLAGAAAFSAASILAAFATSVEMLIGARALLAVAGATLMPSTLAMIRHVFDDEAARTKAVATWNAVLTGGVAVGPIISGVLLEHYWWGSVFLINIPVMVVLLVLAPLVLPGDTADPTRRVDLLSSALVLGSILPFIAGVKDIAADGWSASRVGLLAVGFGVGAVFVYRQRVLPDPMLDLRLLADRALATSIWTNLVCFFALLGIAPSVVVAAAAPLAAGSANRVGRPPVIVAGLLVAASGFVVLGALTGSNSLAVILVGAGMIAAGVVATTAMVTDHVIGIAPRARAGATSGLLETSSELGGALGIAILGSVLNVVYRAKFPPDLATGEAARSLGGAAAGATHLSASAAAELLTVARGAFVVGQNAASWVAAAILIGTAVVAWVALRSGKVRPEASASPHTLTNAR